MIYSKFPVVFLSTLASEKSQSTNCIIATYILEHLEEMKNIGIQELAKRVHVSPSSISRFVREIGLEDFNELKLILDKSELEYTMDSSNEDYIEDIYTCLHQANESIDDRQIRKLCLDIKKYKKVSIFGLLKAESAAINLQTDLLMLGKITNTKVSFYDQNAYLNQVDEDDLIIIFSYTGAYFEYYTHRGLHKHLIKPKIYLISSSSDQKEFVDEHIYFESNQSQTSHPYQLIFISHLISKEYQSIIKNENIIR